MRRPLENEKCVLSLKHANVQTYEMCMSIIIKHPRALQFVRCQTHQMCIEAVSRSVAALKYVKEQTFEICSIALQRSATALYYIRNKSYEIYLEAIRHHIKAIGMVPGLFTKARYFTLDLSEEQQADLVLAAVMFHPRKSVLKYLRQSQLDNMPKALKLEILLLTQCEADELLLEI